MNAIVPTNVRYSAPRASGTTAHGFNAVEHANRGQLAASDRVERLDFRGKSVPRSMQVTRPEAWLGLLLPPWIALTHAVEPFAAHLPSCAANRNTALRKRGEQDGGSRRSIAICAALCGRATPCRGAVAHLLAGRRSPRFVCDGGARGTHSPADSAYQRTPASSPTTTCIPKIARSRAASVPDELVAAHAADEELQ